jgi:hypothetical protein
MGRIPKKGPAEPTTLSDERKLIARRLFRLRVHESKGMAFQRLFEQVMGFRYPNDFIPIKPYGNIGDRKNDGFLKSSGTYHQVFAPEQPTASNTAVAAARKASGDFVGLRTQWKQGTPIYAYRFVFNDEYRGAPPDVVLACEALQRKYNVDARPMLAHELEDEALKLAPDQLMDIIQAPIPPVDLFPSVDFSVLRDVIRHVLENPVPLSRDLVLRAPDLSKKIKFNGLTTPVDHLLHTASWQVEAVTDYFSRSSGGGRQELRNKLSGLYLASRRRFSRKKDSAEFGDLVFFNLLEKMEPADARANPQQAAATQTAALVVMAYYFESCDVFEDPDAAS